MHHSEGFVVGRAFRDCSRLRGSPDHPTTFPGCWLATHTLPITLPPILDFYRKTGILLDFPVEKGVADTPTLLKLLK